MPKPRKTTKRKSKPQDPWFRLYTRYFTPAWRTHEDDTKSLIQPSPLRDIPTNASNGVHCLLPSG